MGGQMSYCLHSTLYESSAVKDNVQNELTIKTPNLISSDQGYVSMAKEKSKDEHDI